MTPEPITPDAAIDWAISNGVELPKAGRLAAINAARTGFGLPPFAITHAPRMSGQSRLSEPGAVAVTRPPPMTYAPPVQVCPPAPPFAPPPKPLAAVPEPEPTATVAPVPPPAPVARNLQGLVEALFDELDGMRQGRGSPERVRAVCAIAGRVNEVINTEIKFRKHLGDANRRMSEVTG